MIKLNIEANNQEEFDEKRDDIVKALVGFKSIQPRRAVHRFQNESMDYFDKRYRLYLNKIKEEIAEILNRHGVRNEYK